MRIQMLLIREGFAFLVTIQKNEKSVLLKMLIHLKLNIKLSGMSKYITVMPLGFQIRVGKE